MNKHNLSPSGPETAAESLLQSEAFHCNVLNALSAHIAVLDHQGVIVAVNEAWRRFARENGGDADRSYLGENYLAACQQSGSAAPNEINVGVLRGIRSVLRGEQSSFSLEYGCHSNDEKRWFLMTVRPVAGTRGGVVVAHENTTMTKHLEAALRESEALLRATFENVPFELWLRNRDGVCIMENHAVVRHWGSQLGKRPEDTSISPTEYEIWRHNHQRAMSGETVAYEVKYVHDGKNTYYRNIVAPVRRGTDIESILGITADITERTLADESLRTNEAKHHAMVANIADVLSIVDREGINKYKSPNIEKWFGWHPDDVIGLPIWNNIHPEDLERTQKFFVTLLKERNAGGTEECRYRCKNGNFKWIEMTGVNLLHDRDIQGILLTYHDLTEFKHAEAEKAKLESMFQQAQKMELVGRLAGGVAHDFNNMLQVILGNAAIALEEIPPGGQARESLEEIQKAAQRSGDLTRQLLAFARRQTIVPKLIDLNEAVEGLLKMLRRLIGEAIQLAWLPARNVDPIKVDPTQVDQLLVNLCVNARDAIGGVGHITLETGSEVFDEVYCASHPEFMPGEFTRLTVSDDGRGMSKETIFHIFEPFFTTKSAGEGTGLGLATVYGIIKQNHGFIHVYSEPDKGATFRLYLPRYRGETAAPQMETTKESPRSAGETVLLVEDDLAILDISRRVLERLGYIVLTASTPAEAIRETEAHGKAIHLLITDMLMPEMNGQDLARRLLFLYPHLKCLFMSGYTADIISPEGVLDESVCFIQKPFSIQDLAVKVREVLATK